MANPALNEKRFKPTLEEDTEAGWASPATVADSRGGAAPPAAARASAMTANGTFAKTFALFLLMLAGGAFGWSQTPVSPTNQVEIPGWAIVCVFAGLGLALVCIFKTKTSPFVSPLYALV